MATNGNLEKMIIYDSIKTYNETFNHPTLHPLVSLLDLSKGNPLKRSKFRLDFYAIIIKDSKLKSCPQETNTQLCTFV